MRELGTGSEDEPPGAPPSMEGMMDTGAVHRADPIIPLGTHKDASRRPREAHPANPHPPAQEPHSTAGKDRNVGSGAGRYPGKSQTPSAGSSCPQTLHRLGMAGSAPSPFPRLGKAPVCLCYQTGNTWGYFYPFTALSLAQAHGSLPMGQGTESIGRIQHIPSTPSQGDKEVFLLLLLLQHPEAGEL